MSYGIFQHDRDFCLWSEFKIPQQNTGTAITLLVASCRVLADLHDDALIFRNREGNKVLYRAYQFFVGIIEAQIDKVDAELTQLMDEYFPSLGATGLTLETKQMRVIPADTAVEAKTTVASYNRMRELIKDDELIAVAPCICTQMADSRGSKCEHTIEIIQHGDPFLFIKVYQHFCI